MTCRDFQRKWDELLDADGRTSPMPVGPDASPLGEAGEQALVDHAAACPDCRQLATRYQVLRHATRAWRQPPVPSADLADRILAAAEVSTNSAWPVYAGPRERVRPVVLSLRSIAAALVALTVLSPVIRRHNPQEVRPANPPAIAALQPDHDLHAVSRSDLPPIERHALNRALADATSATWELARSASEPAARISREALGASTQSGDVLSEPEPEEGLATGDRSDLGAVGLTVPVPSLTIFTPDPSAASSALQQVGDHLSAGVRPLSDTARHAFGFLIGPAPDRSGPRTSPPSAKGA